MVRVVPSGRWQLDRLDAVKHSPLSPHLRSGTFDAIEAEERPHEHLREPVDDAQGLRRVPICKPDLIKH